MRDAPAAVAVHNCNPVHVAWRRAREAADHWRDEVQRALLNEAIPEAVPYEYRASRGSTAGATPVDAVQGDSGASASEGAA